MTLKVGDKIYRVNKRHVVINRPLKSFVDDNGVEWKEIAPVEYNIETCTILGVRTTTVDGEWPSSEDELIELDTKYHYAAEQSSYNLVYQFDLDNPFEPWFCTREEAEDYIKHLEQEVS